MKLWLLALSGILILFIGLGLLFPKEFFMPLRFLGAAIGQIDIPTLRFWQSSGGFTHTLQKGSRGIDVNLIQRSFATDPDIYPKGVVSGYWGSFTQSAFLRFQNEYGLNMTGIFDEATRAVLNRLFYNQLCPVADASTRDLSLFHVTKKFGLPPTYVPLGLVNISKLVRTSVIICVQQRTADALVTLFRAAQAEGISLSVCSGYRGPRIQEYIKNQYLITQGPSTLNSVAFPYHSEHQTGTAVDITGASVGYSCASDTFSSTLESNWLVRNAWRYGFNLSYPAILRDESTREYIYEPWHWRYLGIPIATDLHIKNISYSEIEVVSIIATSTDIFY